MTTQTITLSQQQQNINTGFLITQFKVENPSAFQIYINTHGAIPTFDNAQFRVQANSIFVSPPISTGVLTIFASGLDQTRALPKITFTDATGGMTLGQTSNTPVTTNQFVGNFPGYPFSLPPSAGGLAELPPVTINNFQNVYIQMFGNPDLVNQPALYPVLIATKKDEGGGHITRVPFGVFMQSGGMITYTPRSIPETVIFEVDMGSNSNFTKLFNIIQTADPVDIAYGFPDFSGIALAAGGGASIVGGSDIPGFIMSLDVTQTFAASINANFDLVVNRMRYNAFTGGLFNGFGNIYSQNVNLTMAQNVVYSVKTKLFLESEPSFIQVAVTNNTPSGGGFVGAFFTRIQVRPIG